MYLDDIYNSYSFVTPTCSALQDNSSVCNACEAMMMPFCRKCAARANNIQKEYVPGKRVEFTSSCEGGVFLC